MPQNKLNIVKIPNNTQYIQTKLHSLENATGYHNPKDISSSKTIFNNTFEF